MNYYSILSWPVSTVPFSARGPFSPDESVTLLTGPGGRLRLPLTDRGGFQLADQVRYFLRGQGETDPVPFLGGFVVQAGLNGRVLVYWRLPGLPVFEAARR